MRFLMLGVELRDFSWHFDFSFHVDILGDSFGYDGEAIEFGWLWFGFEISWGVL